MELSRYFRNVRRIIESSEDEGINWRLGGRRTACYLEWTHPLTGVTSMGQKVIFQLVKYLDPLSGGGLDDISGVPGQTVSCANFMLINPLLKQ